MKWLNKWLKISVYFPIQANKIFLIFRQLPQRVHAQGEAEGLDDRGQDRPHPQVVRHVHQVIILFEVLNFGIKQEVYSIQIGFR